ncbi:MAG TPA: peptidase E [Capillimicrobium sp.]|nr:peptidase E [Capillimicrobium sp.]
MPTQRPPQIVAFGGGGFSMEAGNPLLDDYVLGLTGVDHPRVCFLPTASGDADHYIVRFYRAFGPDRCRASHVSLFREERGERRPFAERLLEQDLIYVGGGSVQSLLGAWRMHGLDEILAEAWRRGIVLAGLSSGSLCWFADAVSAFNGPPRRVAGLGLLPYSNAVHYDERPGRREAYHRLMAEGMLDGYAAGDGAALHFVGRDLERVVSSRPQARAYRVAWSHGEVVETPLETRYLGSPEPSAALAA